MKFSSIKTFLGTAATLCVFAMTGQNALAGTLHNNWTYSIDSFKDGTEGNVIGNTSKFEFYGMAFQETAERVYFAINSNLSLNGYVQGGATNGKISYGDLFLNFSNTDSFNQANGDFYAIRFDATNDTGVSLGLYGDVSAKSVTTLNSGYSSTNQHTQTVANLGGSASYGDLTANTSYFNGKQAAPTSVSSGTFLGAISSMMSKTDLSNMGLDFGHFGAIGTQTFGFSIDKSLLPQGSFMASLFAECGNDGMVLSGDLKGVPEPSAIVGLVTVAGLVAGSRLRRRNAQSSVA